MFVAARDPDRASAARAAKLVDENLLEDRHVTGPCALNDADDRAGVSFARWVTLTLTAAKEGSGSYIARAERKRKQFASRELRIGTIKSAAAAAFQDSNRPSANFEL